MPLFSPFNLTDDSLKKKRSRLFGPSDQLDIGSVPPIMSQPPQDTAPIPQPAQDVPSGPSLKQKLFGYSDPTVRDELGVEKPQQKHEGIVNAILKYAGPALFGLAGGVGALPGLASAFAGDRADKNRQSAYDQANYKSDRNINLQNKKLESQQDIENRRAAQQEKFQGGELGLRAQELELQREKMNQAQKGDDKKLSELQGYAGTLIDQLDKTKKDLDKIPSGPIVGRLGQVYSSTGIPSFAANRTAVMNRLNPIVDTYVKMTAGRANRTIIESMKKNLEDAMNHGTGAQRKAAIDSLKDYLESEYRNTAAAHGFDIDTLPTFEDLGAGKFNRGGASSATKSVSAQQQSEAPQYSPEEIAAELKRRGIK